MYPKLVAFDIDGTLLPDTTMSREMAIYLGNQALIDEMEVAWDNHQMDHREFASRSALAYQGRQLVEMEQVAENLPVIAGAAEVVCSLRDSGSRVILATVSVAFAARVLATKLGCDHAGGTELEVVDDVFTGKIARFNDEAAKAAFVKSEAKKHDIPLADVAAIGDSRSDIPLFALVGRSIALNAAPAAKAAASLSIETRDLRDILPLLEGSK